MATLNVYTTTAANTCAVNVNSANRTVSLAGNVTTAADFITSGANSLTLTTTGATNITLPTTGTLTTVAGTETITGAKTFSALALTKATDVAQATNITTAVTSNGAAGKITTQAATTASAGTDSFTVNNSSCLSTSVVLLQIESYSGTIHTNGNPVLFANTIAAGSFVISIKNASANALNGTMVIRYAIV